MAETCTYCGQPASTCTQTSFESPVCPECAVRHCGQGLNYEQALQLLNKLDQAMARIQTDEQLFAELDKMQRIRGRNQLTPAPDPLPQS